MKRRELLDLAKQLYTEDEIFELELQLISQPMPIMVKNAKAENPI